MRLFSADDLEASLDFPSLIDALALAFSGAYSAPKRHHHAIGAATQLLMPAWSANAPAPGAYLGTKIVSVFPGNGALGLPAVNGLYLLQSGETGLPLAVLDGTRLTHLRTAAASALAARHLSRADASHLLMAGTGALAPYLVRAHASVRPIKRVTLWNHRRSGAETLARALQGCGFDIDIADDLGTAVAQADIISCATLSPTAFIQGHWLRAGQHVDLVGAFNLEMREADGEALRRARVYIDTPAATTEGGDVALALRSGEITAGHVRGDLAALCGGSVAGRESASEITLFKSVGASIEDLAAAVLAWQRRKPD